MAKGSSFVGYAIAGVIGGAIAYLGRGEIERLMAGFKGASSAQQARMVIANRARLRRAGYPA